MVAATFTDGRSNPNPAVDEQECRRLSQELVTLILKGSDVMDSFRELTRHRADYAEYGPALQDLVGLMSNPAGTTQDGLHFYQELETLWTGYQAKKANWVDALSLIVELTFLLLMQQKYDPADGSVYHEHTAKIAVTSAQAWDTAPKPIDVIMWRDQLSCGEFLEVKKQLGARIPAVEEGRAAKLVSKIAAMYDLLEFLSSNGMSTSLVGLATLSRDPYATHLVEIALKEAGKLPQPAHLSSLPYQLTVITSADLIEWYTKKVV